MIDRYLDFWDRQSLWSQQIFGLDSERGPQGPIFHLEREIKEVIEAMDLHYGTMESIEEFQMELVDCFFLITDAARRSGLTYSQFMDLAFKKLEINKSRKWGKPTSNEPVEHIRDEER